MEIEWNIRNIIIILFIDKQYYNGGCERTILIIIAKH